MQRDYLLRLIEQVAQLLARAIRQRESSSPQESLQTVMAGCERLFGLEAVRLFQFTPDQHITMLVDGEDDAMAFQKILIYAALNEEAGQAYTALVQTIHARLSFTNSLRLVLKAQHRYPGLSAPDFAPKIESLLERLKGAPLDEDTAALLARRTPQTNQL
jgi:GAF domain-containing protein